MANAVVIERYRRVFAALLPLGAAWARVRENPLLRAIAGEFARVDERGADLLRESLPNTAVELLPDWETLLGLPDDTTPDGLSEDDRRAQAAAKFAARGGSSRDYLQSVADNIAHGAVTVKACRPFRAGIVAVGQPLTNIVPPRFTFSAGSSVGLQLKVPAWTFFFIVEYSGTLSELMRRTLMKRKPAHIGIAFIQV